MAMAEPVDPPGIDPGLLTDNYRRVKSLQKALSSHEMNGRIVSGLIVSLLGDAGWCNWMEPDGKIRTWNAPDFRPVHHGQASGGVPDPIEVVRKLLEGTDAFSPFMEAIRGEPGEGEQSRRSWRMVGQRIARGQQLVNRDNVTVDKIDDIPVTIPLSPDVPRPRNYAREASTGHSVSYYLPT